MSDPPHPYFDPRLSRDDHRFDALQYSIQGLGATTEDVADAFRKFGRAVQKSTGELTPEEKRSALVGELGPEIIMPDPDSYGECDHCGNASNYRDRRGNCVACGARR